MHKYTLWNVLVCLALPMVANAAGTYYTGAAYQPAQYRYGQTGTYATSGYGRAATNAASGVQYNGYARPANNSYYQTTSAGQTNARTTQSQQSSKSGSSRNGFFVNAGISHEAASWQIEMTKVANSMLHYDNVAWNVFDVNGGYIFDLGSTKVQVDAGFKYGMQWGDATMNDDDISNGGFDPIEFWQDVDGDEEITPGVDTYIGTSARHALSVGTSNDGNLLGFNVGVGLTDFLKLGNLKITPSVGYRYFKYKLETKDNYGLSVTSAACFSYENGEMQCDPLIYLYNTDSDGNVVGTPQEVWRTNGGEPMRIYSGYDYIDTDQTYYYTQSGTSHSYETEWSGPYVALDVLYDINQNNFVNGRVELGFPGYTSTGDQPYRWDWAHPKSVEDSSGMFSALHLGLLANWKTAITNNIWLSIGMTYDYYTVSGADAKTYLNKSLYNKLSALTNPTDSEVNQANYLLSASENCGGWVCESKKEVDSVYKSMGIRVGVDARF